MNVLGRTLGIIFCAMIFTSAVAESGGMSKRDYENMFSMRNMKSQYAPAISACLQAWGNRHPFKKRKEIKFRVIQGNVKVFGVGGNISDQVVSNYPQLILVRPGVNVMGKMSYDLLNPNGWYCLKAKVNVMGKSVINLACDSHIASTTGTTTVLGASEGQSGTTVMGRSVVNRNCDNDDDDGRRNKRERGEEI